MKLMGVALFACVLTISALAWRKIALQKGYETLASSRQLQPPIPSPAKSTRPGNQSAANASQAEDPHTLSSNRMDRFSSPKTPQIEQGARSFAKSRPMAETTSSPTTGFAVAPIIAKDAECARDYPRQHSSVWNSRMTEC